jgi:hypothetical protein
MKLPCWAAPYALAVGLMDSATGLALFAAPGWTLALMGAVVPEDPALAYVRFCGTFVAAVGATYLLPLRRGGEEPLRAALASTLIVRLAAGTGAAVSVGAGWLDPAWTVVAVTDLACAAVQVWLLRRRAAAGGGG